MCAGLPGSTTAVLRVLVDSAVVSPSMHACARSRMHAHTRARTYARMHACTCERAGRRGDGSAAGCDWDDGSDAQRRVCARGASRHICRRKRKRRYKHGNMHWVRTLVVPADQRSCCDVAAKSALTVRQHFSHKSKILGHHDQKTKRL